MQIIKINTQQLKQNSIIIKPKHYTQNKISCLKYLLILIVSVYKSDIYIIYIYLKMNVKMKLDINLKIKYSINMKMKPEVKKVIYNFCRMNKK